MGNFTLWNLLKAVTGVWLIKIGIEYIINIFGGSEEER